MWRVYIVHYKMVPKKLKKSGVLFLQKVIHPDTKKKQTKHIVEYILGC